MSISKNNQSPLHLLKDWLEVKEPEWFLDLKPVGTVDYGKSVYYTLSVGVLQQWLGWIDAPHTDDECLVLVWGHGAGHRAVNLREPDSFNRIHQFMKERIESA